MDNQSQEAPPTTPEISQTSQESTITTVEESQEDTLKKSSKIPKIAIYILAFVVLLALGAFSFWIYQEKVTKKLNPTPLPSAVPSPVSSIMPTESPKMTVPADWNNYQNDKYGYSISYPNTWFNLPNYGAPDTDKYFSTKNVSAPLEMGSDGIWITIRINKTSDYFEKVFSGEIGLVSSGQKGNTTKLANLTINSHSAVKYIEETAPGAGTEYGYVIVYAIKKDSNVYTMSFLSFSKDVADKNSETYEQMATSFKFLLSSWKEYKNQTYGFSIQYPQDWIVREYDSKTTKGVPMHGIGFGTQESIPGGMIWGVSVYDIVGDINSEIEDLIGEIGNQFGSDRQEKREQITIKGRVATKVIVTTSQITDWYSENIIFEGNGKIFSIGNGAVRDEKFEDFYKSFSYL